METKNIKDEDGRMIKSSYILENITDVMKCYNRGVICRI